MLGAALDVGVTPVEAKEIVYHAVPYVGQGRVFDVLHATNDVLSARGVELPLPGQATVTQLVPWIGYPRASTPSPSSTTSTPRPPSTGPDRAHFSGQARAGVGLDNVQPIGCIFGLVTEDERGPGGRPVPRARRPHPARHPAPRAGRGALGLRARGEVRHELRRGAEARRRAGEGRAAHQATQRPRAAGQRRRGGGAVGGVHAHRARTGLARPHRPHRRTHRIRCPTRRTEPCP